MAAEPRDLKRVAEVLRTWGGFSASRVQHIEKGFEDILVLGVPPIRIDILPSAPGIDFDESWARRKTVVLDGVSVHMVALSDLRASKKAAGRLKDLADLENLPRTEQSVRVPKARGNRRRRPR